MTTRKEPPFNPDSLSQGLKYYQLGTYYEENGRLQEALKNYMTAFKLDPLVEQHIRNNFQRKSLMDNLPISESFDIITGIDSIALTESDEMETMTAIERDTNGLIIQDHFDDSYSNFNEGPASLFQIPHNVFNDILQFLLAGSTSLKSLFSWALTCKTFYFAIENENLWKILYQLNSNHYPLWWSEKSENFLIKHLLSHLPYDLNLIDKQAPSDEETNINKRMAQKGSRYFQLFKDLPRLRSDGIYICKILYFRPGASEGSIYYQPIHIVTYYRYIYFDQKKEMLLSILSNEEPKVIVPLLVQFINQNYEEIFACQKSGGSGSGSISQPKSISNASKVPGPLKNLMRGYYYFRDNSQVYCATQIMFTTSASKSLRNCIFHMTLELSKKESVTDREVYSTEKLQWKEFFQIDLNFHSSTFFNLASFKNFVFSPVKSLMK